MGNFDFLKDEYPKVYENCHKMENHFSNRQFDSTLIFGRKAIEKIVKEMYKNEGITTVYYNDYGEKRNHNLNTLIKKLRYENSIINNNIYRLFHDIKNLGNDASHENDEKDLNFTENDGRKMIEDVFKASTYFYFEYLKNPKSNFPEFVEVSFFEPKKAIDDVNNEVKNLNNQIFDINGSIQNLEDEIKKLSEKDNKSKEENRELKTLRDQLDTLNTERTYLQDYLNFLDNYVNDKFSGFNSEIFNINGSIQNLKDEIKKLLDKENRTDDDNRELENLKVQLDSLINERGELYDSFDILKNDMSSFDKKISEMSGEVHLLKNLIKTLSEKNNGIENNEEIKEIKGRLKKLEHPSINSYPLGERIANFNIKNPYIGNIILKLGSDKSGSNVELSFGNLAFIGNCKGKYGFIQDLILQLSQYDVPTIIIDTGDNFITKNLNEDFKDSLEGNLYKAVVKAIDFPLNPFKKYKKEIDGRFIDEDEIDIAYRFVNVIGSVYDLTANESDSIQKAVLEGLRNGDDFNFDDLEVELLSQSSMASHSALTRLMELFENNPFDSSSQYNWTYLDNLKGTVNIIQLGGFSTEIQKIILEFILWDLWYYKLSGNKDNPFAVLMDYDFIDFGFDSIASLVLSEGGSYGWSLWLDNCPGLEDKVFNKIEFKPDNSALLDDHEFLFDGKY